MCSHNYSHTRRRESVEFLLNLIKGNYTKRKKKNTFLPYIAGESAGANIAHNASVRAGSEGLPDGVKLVGGCLVHPDFASKERVLTDVWAFANPTSVGLDDPHVNPSKDAGLSKIPWERVLVMLTERDFLRAGGLFYYETMKELSGWGGCVEMMETEEEEHAFHLFNPTCDKAVDLVKRIASFLNTNRG
ncbi:2-hydroxyisoflavanone dehydratase-like [Impatiens glandulifera]|uniref:2-hydroxyisoflavanone dehydratase-like n=1 Tax=Impatiens glandulifera TaxID=253017 RepID=UPI001FB07137|nr:2-hydroxyisoflavanone dehydratase-like [Impatiens glandulifera]